MTIGEKIALLRTMSNISQEQLAEKISVSRQAVSRWEMDQAVPQIEKIIQLCEFFGITTDELLKEENAIRKPAEKLKNKYFGTDGFRGEAGVNLTSMHAYKIGRFLGWYYSSPLSGCTKTGYEKSYARPIPSIVRTRRHELCRHVVIALQRTAQ